LINIDSIIQGYAQGYFIMSDSNNGQLGWYSSNQRTLIPLDDRFHCSSSLRAIIKQDIFTVAINRDFSGVCHGCARREQTWISPELIEVYIELNRAGYAFSFETWQGDKLAGGILGIIIKGAFIGESMFYNISNGSKVALVKLVQHLRSRKFLFFDAQLQNPHLERFGSYVITNQEYQTLLNQALNHSCNFL
jgi:leucyl/phenylalanyl-tRNA--protein transferase